MSRFALAPQPWTAAELHDVLEHVLRVRGWTWLTAPQHPAAYLARLLREIEHLGPDSPQPTGQQPWSADAARDLVARPQLDRTEELAVLRQLQVAARDEWEGHGLCAHGVSGAEVAGGRAPRCAYCRREAGPSDG